MLTSMFTVGKSTSDFLPLPIFWLSQQVLMQLPSLQFLSNIFNSWASRCQKLATLASDGASVMMGKTGSLAAKLQNKPCTTLFNINCVCHRLALASTHSVADIAQVERVETILRQLWKYFDNSPKNLCVR